MLSRARAAEGKDAQPAHWADVEEELGKCGLAPPAASRKIRSKDVRPPAAVFLFCTDARLADRPAMLPRGVLVVDAATQRHFLGPQLAARKSMCLSEVDVSPSPPPPPPTAMSLSLAGEMPADAGSQHAALATREEGDS